MVSIVACISRVAVEFMAGQPASGDAHWRLGPSKTLPEVWKDITNRIASLPKQLEKRIEMLQHRDRENGF